MAPASKPRPAVLVLQDKLAEIRQQVLAQEKAVRDAKADAERRAASIAKTKEELQALQTDLRTLAAWKPRPDLDIDQMRSFRVGRDQFAAKRAALIALQHQESRALGADKKLANDLGKLKAAASVVEQEVQQYGRLVQFPVRPERPKVRRTRRHAHQ